MSAKPSVREALHIVADAVADALEGLTNDNATPVKAPAPKPKGKAINNDLATELARKECLKNGWPLPPNTRRSA